MLSSKHSNMIHKWKLTSTSVYFCLILVTQFILQIPRIFPHFVFSSCPFIQNVEDCMLVKFTIDSIFLWYVYFLGSYKSKMVLTLFNFPKWFVYGNITIFLSVHVTFYSNSIENVLIKSYLMGVFFLFDDKTLY